MNESTQGTVQAGQPVSMAEATEAPVATQVALIVEHTGNEPDKHVIEELTRLLSPSRNKISLVHLVKDKLPESSVQPAVSTLLKSLDFQIVDERRYGLQPEQWQAVIEYIESTGQDLAVFCSDDSAKAFTLRHHAFLQMAMHTPVSTLFIKRPLVPNRAKLKVLLCVDESDASMTAVQKLGRLIPSETMDVLVATVQSPVYQENAILAPFVNQQVLDDALEANATLIFEMTRDMLEAQGISVQAVKRLIGSPGSELGYLAKTEEPDLLVVGSHNRTRLMAWVMGSVSSQLLQWDTHNILIVR